MFDSLPRPTIFAHRGASAYAPENTLASFDLAVAQGTDGIELDVKLSLDGHIVVFHDATVNRTTGGAGKLKDKSLAELREFDAGSLFSDQYRGEKIPTLEEVFELVGKRTFINVELTNYATPRDNLVEKVCALIARFNLHDRVLFSSFFATNLTKAGRLLPQIPRGLLATNGMLGVWPRSFGFNFGPYQALHPYFTDVTPQQVQRVHRLKRRIHVWTVNAENDMRRFFAWGVDGIFTDDPPLALKILGRQK